MHQHSSPHGTRDKIDLFNMFDPFTCTKSSPLFLSPPNFTTKNIARDLIIWQLNNPFLGLEWLKQINAGEHNSSFIFGPKRAHLICLQKGHLRTHEARVPATRKCFPPFGYISAAGHLLRVPDVLEDWSIQVLKMRLDSELSLVQQEEVTGHLYI